MKIFELSPESLPIVADFMCKLKPEWWDYEGALGQLRNTDEMIKTVGWYMGEEANAPRGWILCREWIGLHALELECCGYDDNGEFKGEHKLGDLLNSAETYAKGRGYLTFRSSISSVEFNIHNQEIPSISKAIDSLQCDRLDYKWYLEHGFRVIGIQPNAYAEGFHAILLGKDLR